MRMNPRLSRNPFLMLLIVMVIPIAGAFFSELVMFDLPGNEAQDLVAFMTVTGLTSSLLSYAFYRLGVLEWFRSMRWAIWMVIALLVMMIFLNVWVIARITFIQQHYLALTSVLLVFAGLSALTIGFFASKTMTDRLSQLSDATRFAGGPRLHDAPEDLRQRRNRAVGDDLQLDGAELARSRRAEAAA